MRDNNEGVDQARTWSHMRTSPVRRGSYVLKDQSIRVLGLEQDAVARDTGHVIALDLALKLPQSWRYSSPRLPAISSLEPSSSWSQGTFLLPYVWWQSDQVVVFYLCSLFTWTIKLYPTELLSESSNADLVKALLGLQNEKQAQKQH